MRNIGGNLSIAIRRFRRKPAFFLGACALLALAVGSNTALFAVLNAVMLRPLPLRDADQLVALHVVRDGTTRGAVSLPMFLDVGASRRTLTDVAAYFQWSANLTDSGDAERLQGMRVSANYFEVLGADVSIGRIFASADGRPGGASVVVISDGLWKRHFGGASDVIGRSIRLNGDPFTILGVLRPDFTFQVRDTDVVAAWIPQQDPRRTNAALSFLRMVGRLAPGAGAPQAQAELESRIEEFRNKYPDAGAGDRGGSVVSLREDVVGRSDRLLKMLAGAVALVLLIAAANLTNLLLVNGAGRLQEFAARRAMGASSGRLFRQLLSEALVIAAAGSLLGIALAWIAASALLSIGGTVIPRAAEVSLDASAVFVALLLGLGISVASAALPALQLSSMNPRSVAGQRTFTPGGRKLRAAFVCAEVALSVVLMIGAGLLVRSFVAVQRVEPGFERSQVLSLRLSLPRNRFKATEHLSTFYEQLAPRIRRIAGVSAVAAANVVPMNGYLATANVQLPGTNRQSPKDWPEVHYRMISPDYFTVMGIPVISGRQFSDADRAGGAPVAIVSQGFAKRHWPQNSPLGTEIHVRDGNDRFRPVQIVGVVGDTRHLGLETESPSELYVPIPQVPDATSVWLANNMYWVVKTSGRPLALSNAVRREVAAVDRDVASSFVRSMDQWIEQSVDARRFNLRMIGVFALTALLLAGIGVYGVAAEAVAVRTRELGIRAALGASDSDLMNTVMKGGLGPVLGGAVLGAGAALGVMKMLASFLFGVTSRDPATLVTVVVIVAAVGTMALFIPARRVMRIDPVIALRTE